MKSQKLILLIILFFNLLPSFSQSDFREGYIVLKSNDTIYGLIDYKGNRANAKKCIYKENLNSNQITYTPNDIKEYRFNDSKYYISKTIIDDEKPVKLFLEYLINGVVDIYYYQDYNGRHYFVNDENDILHELKNEEKKILKNGTLYNKSSKEYIGILKFIFKDSKRISKKAESSNLSHKSLINISLDYHNEVCKDEECIVYEKKISKLKHSFGVLGGINILSHAKSSKNIYYTKNKQFGHKLLPSIGLFYKVNIPLLSEKSYFQYEGTYSHVNLQTSTLYIEPVYRINYLSNIYVSLNSFHNSFSIRHEYAKGKFKPTLHAGLFLNYFIKKEYHKEVTSLQAWTNGNPNENYHRDYPNGDPIGKYDQNINAYDTHDYGFHLGIGFKKNYMNNKDFFVDLKYLRGLTLQEGLYTNTFSINIGIEIGK